MDPLILYSINSHLAYSINKEYYRKHYVWCATKFNTNDLNAADRNNPPSSNPYEILKRYLTEIKNAKEDVHHNPSYLIERITGVLTGLEVNKNKNIIDVDTYNQLKEIIETYREKGTIWNELRPLIYIIPFERVKDRVTKVPPSKTASISSEEYIIEDLKDEEFDVIIDLWG